MDAARERIALCMIVRDEEDCLGRCLASARDAVGEVVVVDTGSHDRTPEIAASFGARVIPFAWCDDFAAARNASLEAATRPWALVLDADEELVVEEPSSLARAVLDEARAGWSLPLRNLLDGGRFTDYRVFRMFRRDLPGMRYRGALHEQIVAVAEERVATGQLAGARILHHGYTAERAARKDKGARNLRLAHALVASRPDDPFAWFALGREQAAPEERIASYRRALERFAASGRSGEHEDYVLHLHVDLCKALRLRGDDAGAEQIVERGIALFPRSPDLRFLRGQMLLSRRDAAGAADDLVRCVPTDGDPFPVVVSPEVVAHEGRTLLAVALAHLGRRAEAIAHLAQAAREAPPDDTTALRLLGMLRLEEGQAAAAVEALRQAIERAPDDDALRRLLHRSILALLARSPSEGRATLEAWQAGSPSLAEPCYWLGHAALEGGDVAGAARWWREAVVREPGHALAAEGLRLLAGG